MDLLGLRRLLWGLPRLCLLAWPGGRGMRAPAAATLCSPAWKEPSPPSRDPATPRRREEEDGEEEEEEEDFGTLSARFSSRRLFRKASPWLLDLRLRDRGPEEEEEEEAGPEPAAWKGRRNTPYWYFLQCKRLIKEGKLAEALELFEAQMLGAERLRPEAYNYSVLIGGCGRAGHLSEAFRLFNDMKKRGLEPTDATYTGLFNACAECPRADAGLRVAERLRRQLRGRGLEPRTYHALLKAAARTAGLPLCLDVLEEMVQQGHAVTEKTFCLLLMGCLRHQEAGFRHALQIWRHMLGLGLTPGPHSYNLLLMAARDCGGGDGGTRTRGPEAGDGSPDAPSPAAAGLLAPLGGPAGVLDGLSRWGPPRRDTRTLLAELCEPGFEPALLRLPDGPDGGPDLAFFNALVRKRSRRGDLQGAKALLPLLAKKGLTPDLRTFCGLALGCRRARDGLQLLADLKRAGLTPNAHVYSALIHAALRALDYAYLIRVLRDMRRAGVPANEVVLRQLEFAARYPPSFDRYREKNRYLERIDGFRAYYKQWLRAVPAEETEGPGHRGHRGHRGDGDAEGGGGRAAGGRPGRGGPCGTAPLDGFVPA